MIGQRDILLVLVGYVLVRAAQGFAIVLRWCGSGASRLLRRRR